MTDVGDRFPLAESDVTFLQKHGASAEMGHSRLKADPRPERHLFEDHPQNLPLQKGRALPGEIVGLDRFGQRHDSIQFGVGDVGKVDEMSDILHNNTPAVGFFQA